MSALGYLEDPDDLQFISIVWTLEMKPSFVTVQRKYKV